jgi:hypothetical protein
MIVCHGVVLGSESLLLHKLDGRHYIFTAYVRVSLLDCILNLGWDHGLLFSQYSRCLLGDILLLFDYQLSLVVRHVNHLAQLLYSIFEAFKPWLLFQLSRGSVVLLIRVHYNSLMGAGLSLFILILPMITSCWRLYRRLRFLPADYSYFTSLANRPKRFSLDVREHHILPFSTLSWHREIICSKTIISSFVELRC